MGLVVFLGTVEVLFTPYLETIYQDANDAIIAPNAILQLNTRNANSNSTMIDVCKT
jgi:hypothetical protein